MIGFLSILAVGFFLGMSHATDPDHVIAVTTIVSNQRNGLRAALIAAFWGVWPHRHHLRGRRRNYSF
jgi:high-affinity nickel permease